MTQVWRNRAMPRLALAVVILVVIAAASLAGELPSECVFLKSGANGALSDVQFMPGRPVSFVVIHDEAGKPGRCLYSMKRIPYSITCQGRKPEPFSFVRSDLRSETYDILVFRNSYGRKVCYKPV
jgi:hypothetical protein